MREATQIILLYAKDMVQEGRALQQELQQDGMSVRSLEELQQDMIIGSPISAFYEKLYHQANAFIVIPSQGMNEDSHLQNFIYVLIDAFYIGEKRILPVKYSRDNFGMLFLSQFTAVHFWEGNHSLQLKRLLESL